MILGRCSSNVVFVLYLDFREFVMNTECFFNAIAQSIQYAVRKKLNIH